MGEGEADREILRGGSRMKDPFACFPQIPAKDEIQLKQGQWEAFY